MRHRALARFAPLVAALALAFAAPAWAGTPTGVTGGDTVTGHTGATGPGGGDGGGGTTDVLGPGDGAEGGGGDTATSPTGTTGFRGCFTRFTITGPEGTTGTTGIAVCQAGVPGGGPDEGNEGGKGDGLLPFTGFGLLVLAALAAGLIAGGLEARRRAEQVS